MDISIVTTTYNRKDFLREAIESAEKSVFTPLAVSWEHIIYDDGGADGTDTMIKEKSLKNVVYIQGKENHGPSYGKNRAIEQARGTYILVLDSDDILLARSLYNFISAAHENSEINWFTADFVRVDERLSYMPGEDYWGWQFKSPEQMLEAIFRGEHFLQGNVLFKKSLFTQAGGFDESLSTAEDLDLYIRFLRLGLLPKYCNFISHLHRMHKGNISSGITPAIHKSTVEELHKKYTV